MIERLDHFMARANACYYANRDPFADFVTSPEISQVFGELVGLWCHVVWQMMGAPDRFALIEAGPGQGTLMSDALRALRQLSPDFVSRSELHFLETSPRLSKTLRARFPQATLHDDPTSIPDVPMLLIANEFLDALPIRQIIRHEAGWLERFVFENHWIEQPFDKPSELNFETSLLGTAPVGAIREFSEAASSFIDKVSLHLFRTGGAALFFDYGPIRSGFGETLQAIHHGKPVHPLSRPGKADLTAHVDFSSLGQTAKERGCIIAGPVPQGAFLSALGIHERTARLAHRASPKTAGRLLAATQRLTSVEAMGGLFKAFAIAAPGLGTLPGFPHDR